MDEMSFNDFLENEFAPNRAVVVVTGPFSSGKTAFLETLCNRAWQWVSVDIQLYGELALNVGKPNIGDNDKALLVPETCLGYGKVIEAIGQMTDIVGVVVIVDSSKPETFKEARSFVRTIEAFERYPFVVAANKQDHPEAWEVGEFRKAMQLEDSDVQVLPCIATDVVMVRRVALALLSLSPDDAVVEQAIAHFGSLPDNDSETKTG